jgi:putative phosphoribosyl transferase
MISTVINLLNFKNKFQMRLNDRETAASILGEALKDVIKEKERRNHSVVLGIPRGGVIMSYIIYKKLNATAFDIVIPRRLCAPHNRELGIGAIMKDGTIYLNYLLINTLGIGEAEIEKEKEKQLNEIDRRETLYRNNNKEYNLSNRIIILVDDGAATGATLITAIRWIRKQNPKKVVVAVTVAHKDTIKLLKKLADYVEVIISPSVSSFRSVEQYYHNFQEITDEQVIRIMENNR